MPGCRDTRLRTPASESTLREKPGHGHVPGRPKDPQLLKMAKVERESRRVSGGRGSGRGQGPLGRQEHSHTGGHELYTAGRQMKPAQVQQSGLGHTARL